MKIVSLIPSATEIVCALGGESWLVGRSHECDFPCSINSLPVCTAPRVDLSGNSATIDRQVKDVLRSSLSVYKVKTDLLEELQPDLILTQAHCDVCAVSLKDVETALAESMSGSPRVISLSPSCLAEVWTSIETVAAALDRPEVGAELVASLRERIRDTSRVASSWGKMPTVACIEWIEPLMAAGNWVPEMVELAGGVNLFGTAGEHSPWMEWAHLRRADPEVMVLMPCGFDRERTRDEARTLTEREGWSAMSAVRNGRVWVVDGNAYFNRPGPRLVESFEMLAEMIQPAAFRFDHAGMAPFLE